MAAEERDGVTARNTTAAAPRRLTRVSARVRLKDMSLRSLRLARKHPTGAAGLAVLVAMTLFVLAGDLLTPFQAHRTIALRSQPPLSSGFEGDRLWLGSDELGRDILTRILRGGRTSMFVGFMAPLIGTVTGTLLGIISAYRGGIVDLLMQRLIDVLIAMPGLVLAMAVVMALGFSVPGVILALSLGVVGNAARVVRSHALSQARMEYVYAARALGASDRRIVLRHLLPNSMAVSLVLFTVGVGAAIVAEAGLSFIGLGVQPPTPSWGNMLTFAQGSFRFGPHIAIIPGLAIAIAVLSINMVGDALRDTLDPHLRGRA